MFPVKFLEVGYKTITLQKTIPSSIDAKYLQVGIAGGHLEMVLCI